MDMGSRPGGRITQFGLKSALRTRMPPSQPVTSAAQRSPQVDRHAAAGERAPRDPRLLLGALFLAGVVISGFTFLQGIDPFDEGLVLQAARRVAAGQVPYRDFLWAYGPAQPYLLAGLFKLFGTSLIDWRVLRSLADGGVALIGYVILRPRAPRLIALLAWLAIACEMAEPRNANPFPFALLAVLVALWLANESDDRRLAWLVLLSGLAAAFRLDFAIYGAVAITVVVAIRRGYGPAAKYLAGAVGLTVLVYLPFAISDGPGNLYHALIGNSLSTGAYWSLPFPWVYHASPGAGIGKTVKHAIDFYVPLVALIGYGLAAATAALCLWRERRLPPLLTGLLVLGAGTLAYMLSRTDQIHTQPLFVIVAIGLGLGAASLPRAAGAVAVALLGVLLIHGAANRLSALLRPPHEIPLNVAVADGVMAPTREARSIDRMVALVDRYVPPGGSIYALPRRSDLVRFSDPLIYVLTERRNPTPEDFGLQTGAAAQAQIVRWLVRYRPRILVRWTDPISSSREPNLRGRSTGVHTVDDWVAAHYRPLAVLYHYEVLIARG